MAGQRAPRIDGLQREIVRTPDEVVAMLRLWELGWRTRRIAAEFGCSRNTVTRYVGLGGWAPPRVARRPRALDARATPREPPIGGRCAPAPRPAPTRPVRAAVADAGTAGARRAPARSGRVLARRAWPGPGITAGGTPVMLGRRARPARFGAGYLPLSAPLPRANSLLGHLRRRWSCGLGRRACSCRGLLGLAPCLRAA